MVLWKSVNWTPHVDHQAISAAVWDNEAFLGTIRCPAFTWPCFCHPLVWYQKIPMSFPPKACSNIFVHLASADLLKSSRLNQSSGFCPKHCIAFRSDWMWTGNYYFYSLILYIFYAISILLSKLLLDSLFLYVSPGQVWKSRLRVSWIA